MYTVSNNSSDFLLDHLIPNSTTMIIKLLLPTLWDLLQETEVLVEVVIGILSLFLAFWDL